MSLPKPRPSEPPRIYVACLAAYTAGDVHGKWIDASQDADGIYQDIQEMLSESPAAGAEAWAIYEYEGFGDIEIGEDESIDTVARIASLIIEHGDAAIAAIKHAGIHWLDEAEMMLTARYCGAYRSLDDYADELFWQLYGTNIPKAVRCYVDTEAFGRGIKVNRDIVIEEVDGIVHVFECW